MLSFLRQGYRNISLVVTNGLKILKGEEELSTLDESAERGAFYFKKIFHTKATYDVKQNVV